MVLPPSTTIDRPVMYRAPSDARNATSSATSSGVPGLPTGVFRPPSISAGDDDPVSIQPGATELTVTPCGPVSIASARVSPSIAPSPALSPKPPGQLTTGPVTDATFTTLPQPRSTMPGSTARVVAAAVFRLTAMSRSHWASVIA